MLKLQNLLDESKYYETVRELMWPEGVDCPHCHSKAITKPVDDVPAMTEQLRAGIVAG